MPDFCPRPSGIRFLLLHIGQANRGLSPGRPQVWRTPAGFPNLSGSDKGLGRVDRPEQARLAGIPVLEDKMVALGSCLCPHIEYTRQTPKSWLASVTTQLTGRDN